MFVEQCENFERIIILCQAPADIPYVLILYEKYRENHPISIYIINIEGMYLFLKGLNLSVEDLTLISNKPTSFKNLISILSARNRINQIWNDYFSNYNSGLVFFFSRFEDHITSSIIHRFSKSPTINIEYISHYDDSDYFPKIKFKSLKIRILLLIYRFITNVKFEAKMIGRYPEFPVNNYTIKKTKLSFNLDLVSKYEYKIKLPNNQNPYVLIFISPCECTIFDSYKYDDELLKLILRIKQLGFTIVVKGHPRMELPSCIKPNINFEIPSYIPAEFLQTCDFRMCIGLNTNAICHFAKNKILPTYSVMRMFKPSDKSLFEVNIKFLEKQSNGEILFINNYMELEAIMNNSMVSIQ